MLKLIGASLIIGASTFGGIHIAKNYEERPRQLRLLQQALQMLETEMIFGSTPLYQAMNHISERIPGKVQRIFKLMGENLVELDGASAFECWEIALNKHVNKTSLKAQDKEILLQFGQTLGVSDKEDQRKHIQLAIQNLATEEILAREEQKTYEKLSKNLGLLLGLLLVILMY